MSKIKNIPGVAWLVIGILVTLLVIPSTAYAAALKFAGIEGVSKNKADVTSADQLLTTESLPTNYFNASTNALDTYASPVVGCTAVSPALPAGDDAIVQHLDADFFETAPQTTTAGQNNYGSIVQFYIAPTSSNFCTTLTGETYEADAIPPGGDTASVDLPFQPGFVLPNGDQIYAYAFGSVWAETQVHGYLIPESDAAGPAVMAPASSAGQGLPLPKA
jgi:hypothetical protein